METLISIFREVRDPRAENARHPCASMLFISLIAALCGCKSAAAFSDFAGANLAFLQELVELPHGAPSHDCFSRLFRLLDPQEMAKTFGNFARAFRDALGLPAPGGVVAVDGKSIRRAYERGRAFMPALMISVWDEETRLSIAARASADGNEVAAVLEALKSLDLKGCVVTADALHCHPAMAREVRARGGHYALKLKGNNAPLQACARKAFAEADAKGATKFFETDEKGHDRREKRRASVVAAPADAPDMPGLVMFGRIQSERVRAGGKPATFTYYVALSRRVTPRQLMKIVRKHWSVENHLHRPLDVVFDEDDARARKDHAPQNISFIRRMALDILKTHPDTRSIQRKMNLAAWDKEFLFSLFTHMR